MKQADRRPRRAGRTAALFAAVVVLMLGASALGPFACLVSAPVGLVAFAIALLWLRSDLFFDYRAATGACPWCNYDLHGLDATEICPECGKRSPRDGAV